MYRLWVMAPGALTVSHTLPTTLRHMMGSHEQELVPLEMKSAFSALTATMGL